MSRPAKRDAHATEAVDDDGLARLLTTWIHLSMKQKDGSESMRIEMDAGLTVAQARALHLLAFDGSTSVSSLTAKLGMSVSAVSHLAQRLVEMGLVVREEDARDRRQKTLSLAAPGRKLVERIMKARFLELRASVERLSPPLKRDLRLILERIVTEMSATASDPQTGSGAHS